MKRQQGFYKVMMPDRSWEVALYTVCNPLRHKEGKETGWFLVNSDSIYSEEYFLEINEERILMPDEKEDKP